MDDGYQLRVKLAHDLARAPVRATEHAAGYDLCSVDTLILEPGARAVVSTGLVLEIPPGAYGRVAPRSGLAAKHGIGVLGGVVDADYRGIVKVILHNTGTERVDVCAGTRIAQLILERHITPEVVVVRDVDETSRGDGGFGSTGA